MKYREILKTITSCQYWTLALNIFDTHFIIPHRFQTLELKLIGPSLVGCGVFFALLRILFCTVRSLYWTY